MKLLCHNLVLVICLASLPTIISLAHADEQAIRKNLAKRFPKMPNIDGVNKTPMIGVFEVRVGKRLFYSDPEGNFLLEGNLVDTRAGVNLTEKRLEKLAALDFENLPLKDAFAWKHGSGARKLAVFADPNCAYCKRLESDIANISNVTVFTFLIPILGPDSEVKARNVWCAKNPLEAWRNWMLQGKEPPISQGSCDSSNLERNLALATAHKVTGTPSLMFENGKQFAGVVGQKQLEQQLDIYRKDP